MTFAFPDDLDTPELVVDIDRLDRNIERMATRAQAVGVALRPHAKTHKSIEVVQRQLGAGVKGITVATIGEAEVFAERSRRPSRSASALTRSKASNSSGQHSRAPGPES